jgi:hypothetical protein
MNTAIHKYDLSIKEVSSQYLYNQLAVRSLPTSSVPAITAIGRAAALKIAIRPAMLNQAATAAMASAVIRVNIPNNIVNVFIL